MKFETDVRLNKTFLRHVSELLLDFSFPKSAILRHYGVHFETREELVGFADAIDALAIGATLDDAMGKVKAATPPPPPTPLEKLMGVVEHEPEGEEWTWEPEGV